MRALSSDPSDLRLPSGWARKLYSGDVVAAFVECVPEEKQLCLNILCLSYHPEVVFKDEETDLERKEQAYVAPVASPGIPHEYGSEASFTA